MRRRYFDVRRPPAHSTAAIRGNDGIYRSLAGGVVGISIPCEHCDGERSPKVRADVLRGFVCPHCDSAIDEMLAEKDDTSSPQDICEQQKETK